MRPPKQLWRFMLQDILLIMLTMISAFAALVAGAPPSVVAAPAITLLFFLFYLIARYQSNMQRLYKKTPSSQHNLKFTGNINQQSGAVLLRRLGLKNT